MHRRFAIRVVFLLVALTASMFLVPVPVSAINEYPYEQFGPRVDNILIKMYNTERSEFDALVAGDVDVIDWPLTKDYRDLINAYYSDQIQMDLYGGAYSMFVLDLNNDLTRRAAPGESPGLHYTPTYLPAFRHAIAHIIDRDYIRDVSMSGLAQELYTHVGPMYGASSLMVNLGGEDIGTITDTNDPAPQGSLKHEYSPAKAAAILDAAGIVDHAVAGNPDDADSYREYPVGHPAAGTNIDVQFFYSSDDSRRTAIWTRLTIELANLNIKVTSYGGASAYNALHVMNNKEADLYTGWHSLGSDPDHIWHLYASQNYWDPGQPPNYMKSTDGELDEQSFSAAFPADADQAITANRNAQRRMAEGVFNIPLIAPAAPKAYRKYYGSWGGAEAPYAGLAWKGFVNEAGFGYNSWWSFLNAYPEGYEAGAPGATIRYGFKVLELQKLNPVYASGYWDWEVMNKVYDSLVKLDPYDKSFGGDIAWLSEYFGEGLWYNPDTAVDASRLVFQVRKDVYFSDGVQLTADDIIWTWQTLPNRLIANGLPPPSWYSSIADIVDIVKSPLDPFRFTVYMKHLGIWDIHRIGTMLILPKHMWEPKVPEIMNDNQKADIQAVNPEPTLTGSGPYKFVDYQAGSHVLLTANKPASVGYANYQPVKGYAVQNADGSGINVFVVNRFHQSVGFNLEVYDGANKIYDFDTFVPPGQLGNYGSGSVYGAMTPINIPLAAGAHSIQVKILAPAAPTGADKDLPAGWAWSGTYSISLYSMFRGDIDLNGYVGYADVVHMIVYFGNDYTVTTRAGGYPKFPEYWIVQRTVSIHTADLLRADANDPAYLVFNLGKGVPEFPLPDPTARTILYVSPTMSTAPPTGSFSIDIMIADVADLISYDFKLGYDPTILQARPPIVVGNFFPTSYTWKTTVDNVNGVAWLSVSRPLGTPSGVSGSGKLATITFDVIGSGASYLDLYDSMMSDNLADPIVHAVFDGYFSNAPTVVAADLTNRAKNRPEYHNFKISQHGNIQTLHGEIKNLGTGPVQARVHFMGYDETGLIPIDGYSETVILQVGETREVSWGMPVTLDMAGYRYHVTNICEFDTDGDGLGDAPDGIGPTQISYKFRIEL